MRHLEVASRSLGNATRTLRSREVTREQVSCWLAIVSVSVFLSLLNFNTFQLGSYGDDVKYSLLAQSLLRSEYYGSTWHAGPPGVAPFPFGFPLLLAPILYVSAGNFEALKAVSLVATVLNSAILFWGWHWLSRRSQWWGVTIAGLYSLHPLVIDHSRMVMSEPVFLTVSLIAMILAEHLIRNENQQRLRAGSLLLSGSLLMTMAIRSIGVIVVAGILVYLWRRKGLGFWKELVAILLQMSLLFGLIAWLTPVQARDILPSRYIAQLFKQKPPPEPVGEPSPADGGDADLSLSDPVFGNPGPGSPFVAFLQDMFEWGKRHLQFDFVNVVLPITYSAAIQGWAAERGVLIGLILFGLSCAGLVFVGFFRSMAEEGLSAFVLLAVLIVGALFLWEWGGPRLLYPVLPQLLMGFLYGAEAGWSWLLSRLKVQDFFTKVRTPGMISLVLFMIVTSTYKSTKVSNSYQHIGDLRERSRWLKQHADTGSVVISEAPVIDYFYSGLTTLPYPAVFSPEQLLEFVESNEVGYILVAPSLKWQEFDYVPVYSGQARDTLPFIEALVSNGRAELTYYSDINLVRVYRVNQP